MSKKRLGVLSAALAAVLALAGCASAQNSPESGAEAWASAVVVTSPDGVALDPISKELERIANEEKVTVDVQSQNVSDVFAAIPKEHTSKLFRMTAEVDPAAGLYNTSGMSSSDVAALHLVSASISYQLSTVMEQGGIGSVSAEPKLTESSGKVKNVFFADDGSIGSTILNSTFAEGLPMSLSGDTWLVDGPSFLKFVETAMPESQ